MARLINTDGTETMVYPSEKETGFTLEELYSMIGCELIEALTLRDGSIMVLDEEGKFKKSPKINITATKVMQRSFITSDIVVGKVIICNSEELR